MRPITLSGVVRKMFEKILLGYWQQQEWSRCSRLQSGFVKGKSTLVAALNVDEAMRRGNKFCVLLDLKAAYDTVPHTKLIEIMKSRHATLADMQLFHSLNVHQANTRLVVNGQLTPVIPVRRGVAQGSMLSPLLFNVAFDTLLQRLDDNSDIPSASGFADDLTVLGLNLNVTQQRLEICYQWALEMDMTWNVMKCIAIGLAENEELTLGGQIIPRLAENECTKYVGYDINRFGISWPKSIERLSKKSKGALSLISNIGSQCNAAIRTQLAKMYVRSITDYSLAPFHAWLNLDRAARYKFMTPLFDIHRLSLSFIADTASTHCTQVLESMFMMPTPEVRAMQLRASVHDQLQRLSDTHPLRKLSRTFPPSNSILLTLSIGTDPLTRAIKKMNLPATVASRKWVEHHVGRFDGKTLHTFIAPSARVKGQSRIDACLLQDNDTFSKALAWRRNVVHLNATCHCGRGFTRSHIDQCDFHPTVDTTTRVNWFNARGIPCHGYNAGDEFLNRQEYDKFLALYEDVAKVEDNMDWDGPLDHSDAQPRSRISEAGLWMLTKENVRIRTIQYFAQSVAEWAAM